MMGDLTPRAQQALALSKRIAVEMESSAVGTEHLLLGIVTLGQGVAVNSLLRMGVDFVALRTLVQDQTDSDKKKNNSGKPDGEITHTPRLKKVIALAGQEAKELSHSYIGTEHLLLGILRDEESLAAKVLHGMDIELDICRKEILSEIDPNYESSDMETASAGSSTSDNPKGNLKTPALKSFGR